MPALAETVHPDLLARAIGPHFPGVGRAEILRLRRTCREAQHQGARHDYAN
jgi:hypothetical protein